MGKKNNVLVGYLSDVRRFADLFNGYFYQGRQEIIPGLLEEASEKYDGPLARDEEKGVRSEALERIRDVKKRYPGRVLRILALEDLDNIDYTVGVRNMEYDALEYRRQLEQIRRQHKQRGDYTTDAERLCGFCREDRLTAVSTLWLYHGAEPYDGPRSLKDMLNMQGDADFDQVADYPVHLLCVDRELDVNVFHTEIKQLFQVLQRRDDKKAMKELFEMEEGFRHLDADTVEAISVAIDRPGIWENRNRYIKEEGGYTDICKAMDEWEAEAREQGIEQGREQGKMQMCIDMIKAGLLTIQDAVEKLGMEEEALSAGLH